MEMIKATRKDVKLAVPILVECFNMKTEDEAKETFFTELDKHHHYIIAFDDGKPLGLISWVMWGRPKHGLYELYHVGVTSTARGKGVAQELFKAMEDDAAAWYKGQGSRARKVFIMTHHDNERAQKFYEKMGTHKEATLKSHYYDDKDEVVYSKFFKEVSTTGSSK